MRGLALVALLFSWSSTTWAQDQEPTPSQATEPAVDRTKFGVSLERIQRGLRLTETREQQKQAGTTMRLEYQVQVYGLAPRIEVLKGVDLFNGPVPGTAPSHRQFIEHVTPQIYRTPGLPLSAVAFWLANQFSEKSKKSRCEEEIEIGRAHV